jgi:hypothetical protein
VSVFEYLAAFDLQSLERVQRLSIDDGGIGIKTAVAGTRIAVTTICSPTTAARRFVALYHDKLAVDSISVTSYTYVQGVCVGR